MSVDRRCLQDERKISLGYEHHFSLISLPGEYYSLPGSQRWYLIPSFILVFDDLPSLTKELMGRFSHGGFFCTKSISSP